MPFKIRKIRPILAESFNYRANLAPPRKI